jgi:hypothetical protein
MKLFKRHIGRRVAGVGIGVALLVLGLEAPAFAAPAITAISPTSGPALYNPPTVTAGCVVKITGTGFDQPGAFAVDTVKFTGTGGINTVAAKFHVVSDTEIWTTVPGGGTATTQATTGAITVSDGETPPVTANSPVFTITTGASPDPCGPTITSFTPTCGVVGTVVTITGTNLLKSAGDDSPTPVTKPVGGDVLFNPYTAAATAAHTGAAESPQTLVVNVPSAAKTGPIKVTTFSATGGTVTSTGSFTVVTDPALCGVTPTTHARSVSLSLRKHLVARGKVSVGDGFTDCAASVPVKIQHRVSGRWKTVGSTTTTATGAYNKRIRDRAGKYRAKAPSVSLGTPVTDICSGATSPVRRVS